MKKKEGFKSPIPRKSAALFIFRQAKEKKDLDYEFLLLRRKVNMSFGNMMAAPGGVLEKNDSTLLTKVKKEQIPDSPLEEELFLIYRITALREVFEETGVFFLDTTTFGPKNHENDLKIFEIVSKIMKNTSEDKLFEELVGFFGLPLANLIPVGRIITIQNYPKRYDTTFFGIFLSEPNILGLNIGTFLVNKTLESLFDLNNLKINTSESQNYAWTSPKQCLDHYYEGKIDVPPPLVIHFLHFLGFPEMALLQKFYKEDFKGKIEAKNELLRRPFYYPCLFMDEAIGTEIQWIFPGDEKYPLQKALENETCEEFKNELIVKSRTLDWDKPQIIRLQTTLDRNKRLRISKVIFLKSHITYLEGLLKLSNPSYISKSKL